MFPGTSIRSGVSWLRCQLVKAGWRRWQRVPAFVSRVSCLIEPDGTDSTDFYHPHKVTRFITWRLKRSFWGECRRGSKNFWNLWACLRFGSVSGSQNKKKGSMPFSCICGALDKYQMVYWLTCQSCKDTRVSSSLIWWSIYMALCHI